MKIYICKKTMFCSTIAKYINIGDYVYKYENIKKAAIRGSFNEEYNNSEQVSSILTAITLPDFFEFVKDEPEDVAGGGIATSSEVLAIPIEYGNNPVLDPSIDRAYYPSALYFANGFNVEGASYKYICIHSGDVNAGGGLIIAGSQDFKTWVQLNSGNPLIGLPSSAHHAHIIKLEENLFRLYYWDSSNLYSVSAIRTATSTNLINWTNDKALKNGSNPIITGIHPDWNRGSYGPCECIYNPNATNTGTNPFDYSYALYFDATTGGYESIGLGYSSDGITFNLYGLVLDHSSFTHSATPWDSGYSTFGRIIKTPLGSWMMFYSGGINAAHEGVGVAISNNGLEWTKLTTSGPLISTVINSWREQRVYAVSIMSDFDNRFSGAGDEVDVKMLISGRDSSGNYTCGYFNIPYIYANVKELAYRLGKL